MRLRPEGLHMKATVAAETWFSNSTESVCAGTQTSATRRATGAFYNFRGRTWQRVNQEERQLYLRNAYRVILTRVRMTRVARSSVRHNRPIQHMGESAPRCATYESSVGTYDNSKEQEAPIGAKLPLPLCFEG
jgi:hypothetical protein